MSETTPEVKNTDNCSMYALVRIRGLPFPASHGSNQGTLEKVIDMKPKDNDIFIVTYPKCGTTWTTFMVWEIMHKGAVPPSPNQMGLVHIPFLEFVGLEALEKLDSPRVMKTHLPFNLQPYSPSAKYIYVLRNPWDCCVSYKYHRQMYPALENLSFDDHFEQFIRGDVSFGDFFDHVLSWYSHRNDPNVLLLTYEDMKKDAKGALLKIAKFLGDNYYEYLQDEEILRNCLKYSDFKYMKEQGLFFPKSFSTDMESSDTRKKIMKLMGQVEKDNVDFDLFKEVPFFRKGTVGDWKNHFSQAQIKRFNEYMIKKLRNTEMENFWETQTEEGSFQQE